MRKTVMIVEDDVLTQTMYQQFLFPDYNLVFVDNGLEAYRQAKKIYPNLIILDVCIPNSSGYIVCKMVKADPDISDIPIIFVSALDHPDDVSEGLASGAEEFITKPISPMSLLDTIAKYLSKSDKPVSQNSVLSTMITIESVTDSQYLSGLADKLNKQDNMSVTLIVRGKLAKFLPARS